jgi:dTDP-glucose 4,6-dehydratase
MNTTIFVIGSNSFSGASFTEYALNHDCSVIGISRSEEQHNVFLPYAANSRRAENFEFQQLDLNKDLEDIIALVKQQRPEYIFNSLLQGNDILPAQRFSDFCTIQKIG